MIEFTFLTKEQFYSLENDGIFDGHGEIAKITDFATLLGGWQPKNKDGVGEWWTKTSYYDDEYDDEYDAFVCYVNLDEDEMALFLMDKFRDCPYFMFNDEYTLARKQ